MSALEEVLAAHRLSGIACSCMGWNADLTAKTLMRTVDQHRAHVVEQIQPLIDAEKRAAVEEALAPVKALAEKWERLGGDNPGAIGIARQIRAALATGGAS